MTDSIKVLENLTELLYQEINRCSHEKGLADKSYDLLREAAIDALNLRQKLSEARAWAITNTN
jgi:hypothetical protein